MNQSKSESEAMEIGLNSTIEKNSTILEKNQEKNVQVDLSATIFDLETISSYGGLMRIVRLQFVADRCQSLRQEAFFLILKFLQETHWISLYKKIFEELNRQNVQFPSFVDSSWPEKTQRSFTIKLDKLDTDLRNYRTNSMKDLIRRGHEDLGDHYFDAGDFFNSIRCYLRARDYCASPRHLLTMCLNVIKPSIFMENWSNVLSFVNKANQIIESLETANKTNGTTTNLSTEDAMITSRLKIYSAIAELGSQRYRMAARQLVGVPFEHCSNRCQDIILPQTLIQYVCLCALSSFSRSEIQNLILSSANIKQYLELEPAINEILTKFHQASYSTCLNLLSKYEPIFLLDIYLAPHLKNLLCEIRHRMIITYFSPYKNARMETMAANLNTNVEKLEEELVFLIRQGKIQARIDSKNKILYVADTDQRWSAYQRALEVTNRTKNITQAVLLRTAIIRGKLYVKDPTEISFRPPAYKQTDSFRRQIGQQVFNETQFDEETFSEEGFN